MKITETESAKAGADNSPQSEVLSARLRAALRQPKSARPKSSREEAIEVAEKALADVPDVREDVVAELQEKISKGEYRPGGPEIADMMIRRMKADRIR